MGVSRIRLATGLGTLGGFLSVALAEEARQAPAGLTGLQVEETIAVTALVFGLCAGIASLLLPWRPREAGHALSVLLPLYAMGMATAFGAVSLKGAWYEAVGRVVYVSALLLVPLLLLGFAAYVGVTSPIARLGGGFKRSS